jgi:hypothetical protein
MKEEQIVKASLMAGLITRTIHTRPSTWESETLNAWTEEHPDNQLLLEELTDPDSLNQLLHDFYKYKPVIQLKKINQRIFGNTKDLTNC